MIEWFDIKSHPPEEHEDSILVFPLITDGGHFYTVSSVAYALGPYANFTHWAKINPPNSEAFAAAILRVEMFRHND